jgi:hypothetical protein
MKLQSILRLGKAALLASISLFAATFEASATNPYDLSSCGIGPAAPGQFSCLSVFTLNQGSGDTNILSNNAKVQGAMAVAGSGKITMNNFSRIEGNLSYKTNGTLNKASTATITGTIYKNSNTDSLLNAGVQAAFGVSDYLYNNLSTSPGYPTTINSNTSLSLTSNGLAVLKLTDFKLSNQAVLTLNGSSSSYFVINVKEDFSLSNAKVVLSGGITWDHVIFNVRGSNSKGTTIMSGNSQFNGVILATQRTFTMKDNAAVSGAVVANTVNLSGNAVIKCPNVSP